MRINIYAEELTERTELVAKTVSLVAAHDGEEVTFYGTRVYLVSPDVLHATPEDDDSSAVTFWVPWTKKDGHDFALVRHALKGTLQQLDTAQDQYEAQFRAKP